MYYTLVYSDMSRPPRTNVVIAHCDNFRSRKGMPRDIRYGKIMFSNLSERDLEFFKMQQYLFTTKFIVDKSTSFAKLKERVAIHLLQELMYYFLHYSKEINYIIYVTPKMDKDGVVWGKVIAFNDPNSVFKIGEEGFWFSKTDEDIKELFKDKKLHKVMEKYLIEIL